jgi:leader peptidase (prepilin peptidase)/N-methyltransferase
MWEVLIVLLLGLVFGSFLNVVVYRTTHELSPIKGRSICEHCGHQIRWFHNIPLLSFLLLRGKCYDCGKPIGWQHPIVEGISALLFLWWYMIGMGLMYLGGGWLPLLQPVFWLLVGMCLLVIFFADLWYGIIPDGVNLTLLILSLSYRVVLIWSGEMKPIDFLSSILAGLILMLFFFALWAGTKGKGFGGGDVKLAPSLGLLLGWERTLVMFMVSFVMGAIVAITFMILKKKKWGQTIPLGPFLVLGTFISLLFGYELFKTYVQML